MLEIRAEAEIFTLVEQFKFLSDTYHLLILSIKYIFFFLLRLDTALFLHAVLYRLFITTKIEYLPAFGIVELNIVVQQYIIKSILEEVFVDQDYGIALEIQNSCELFFSRYQDGFSFKKRLLLEISGKFSPCDDVEEYEYIQYYRQYLRNSEPNIDIGAQCYHVVLYCIYWHKPKHKIVGSWAQKHGEKHEMVIESVEGIVCTVRFL